MSPLAPVTSPLLAALPGVRHAFFTREGGVSTGVYASLNVGRGSRDDLAVVEENRARAAGWFGLPADRLKTRYQVHSNRIALYEEEQHLDEAVHNGEAQQADGVLTWLPRVACGVLSADCAPVLLADPIAGVVCAAHAGWKGALAGIVEMAVTAMLQDGGSSLENIVAAVGPCIGPASYEVGQEFRDRFTAPPDAGAHYAGGPHAEAFFAPRGTAGKWSFDLPGFVLDRLARAGVARAEWVGLDTCADEARFFSNRRAFHRGEADYGRLLSAIALV